MASTPLLTLFLSVLFTLNSFPAPSFSCQPHQKQALLHLKSTLAAFINSSPDLDSWNMTSDCCSWQRVYCTETGTVGELNLSSLVPPRGINLVPLYSDVLTPLFHIRSLVALDISSNSLVGEIPGDGFGNLTKLVYLDMHENRFSGSIPSQIWRLVNLLYLDMSFNLLEEKLGPELGSLRNLTTLWLKRNRFHGLIPPQLFELGSLQSLDLSDNQLEGVLSPEVGKLQNLEYLILKANFLFGKIPEEIGNLIKLREFSLQNNKFFGRIPSSIVNLKKLEALDLSENSLSMQIPNSIGTLPNVTAVDLSDNTLTGPIPSSMQNMSKLIILRLHNNMLDGEITTWLFKIITLMELFIGGKGNNLIWNNEAKIVPNCNLMLLSMSSCNISGQIPEWISSQKDMRFLDLSNNKLVGRFPDVLADRKLEIIIMS
ncbi:hypothetical protein L1987_82043 [Smallanthus sonchifolius]|uniref:Uncharacterized protein n=1 Tax=Smallanthus sonchifolius TaxID=185202 RepID=A0ACB8YT87_9ASTR|nr:hypothetical protein L1987_82043 [Smallanthus sonchifolius]